MKTRVSHIGLAAAVLLGGVLVCCPVTTQAAKLRAGAGEKGAPAKKHFKNLAQELNLTAEQRHQLGTVLKDEAQRLKSLRAESGTAKRQKRAQLIQIRREAMARIKEILTPEQLEQWQKLRAETRARHHTKRHSKTAGL